jgi:phosphatidate cytidylyltransferase
LIQRILTALVLVLVIFGILFFDPTTIGIKVFLLILISISFLEWAKITASSSPLWLLPAFLGCVSAILAPYRIPILSYTVIPIAGYLVSTSLKHEQKWVERLASNIWLYLTLTSMITLSVPAKPNQLVWILLATIPIWVGDSCGLFVGKAIGKRPLAPTISPKKTIEGGVGNFIGCVASAFALSVPFHVQPAVALLIGLNCGIIGQVGDLFQSHLKRMADLKDSGNILPGHGGVLDRIDSLMTSVPVTLALLVAFGYVSI